MPVPLLSEPDLVPEKCPLCGKGMAMIGYGTQRLEEELKRKLPSARITRVDSDSMAGSDYYSILRISALAKSTFWQAPNARQSLHFPNVTVVGIISAETSLYLPDFRLMNEHFS